MSQEQLIVPDFDTYSARHALVRASIFNGGIKVIWDDGLESRLPAIWLREFSPDLHTFHGDTREQRISLTDIPADLSANSASISPDGFLCIHWLPEDLKSRYHPGWLRAHLPEATETVYELPEQRLWRDTPGFEPTWFNGEAVHEGHPGALKPWLESLRVHGVGLLNELPIDPKIIPAIPELIGPIRISNFGQVFEVASRQDGNSNAYTAIALAPHSDLSTREYIPGLQFLFCLVNDATGGDSILVDGFSIAEQLRQESEEFYEVLATAPIPFGNKDKDSDYRYSVPILEHDRTGTLSTIRYTYWLRSPMTGSFNTIKTFYAAFRRFQELVNEPANQFVFRLNPGEMMAFDNRRVLHGRTAFDPASGNRLLRGCYSERDELDSRLRILARRERQEREA